MGKGVSGSVKEWGIFETAEGRKSLTLALPVGEGMRQRLRGKTDDDIRTHKLRRDKMAWCNRAELWNALG